MTLTVRRDGQAKTIAVSPTYDAAEEASRIGFRYGSRTVEVGVGGAAQHAVDSTWFVTKGTVSVFARLFEERKAQGTLRRGRRQ